MVETLFEDIFTVTQKDPDGKKFDREILMVLNGIATGWRGNKKSLADKFEYVMHGKLYRISEEGVGKHVKADIFVSFGGLLMQLRGDPSIAAKFELDQKLFILIRKV